MFTLWALDEFRQAGFFPGLPPPLGAQLDPHVLDGQILLFGHIEPSILFLGLERTEFRVVTPCQIVPTPVWLNATRHICEVPQTLNVIACNSGRILVALTPTAGAVANPVTQPPLTAAGHSTEPMTGPNPLSDIDILFRRPSDRRRPARRLTIASRSARTRCHLCPCGRGHGQYSATNQSPYLRLYDALEGS